MADSRNTHLSDSERNARYIAAAHRFAAVSTWREYMALAEEFHALDTYKDAPQMYAKCMRAAAAPAYREVTEKLAATESLTTADYREAARILQRISDFGDAREVARVCTVKANALAYEEAVTLITNSDATTAELGRGVALLREIKTYKNARDLLDRYEKYYFERMYAEAILLEETGHVYTEFEEAAALFEAIVGYSDAAAHAAACRKRANKLRPRRQKAASVPAPSADEAARVRGKAADTAGVDAETVKPRRRPTRDETRNTAADVWRTLDKRRLVWLILWVLLLVAALYASVVLPGADHPFCQKYADEIRGVSAVVGVLSAVMGVRTFLQMLTASMRQKLRAAALRTLKKMAAPIVRAVNKMLMSIGIDLSRRGRIGGRDEKTFVFQEEERAKKPKKRLKNDLKWQDQTDNAARVRYIYIDYMIRKVREGYGLKRTMTPAEIGRDVAVEPDEQRLFAVYDKARYAGREAAAAEITDSTVTELGRVNQKRS